MRAHQLTWGSSCYYHIWKRRHLKISFWDLRWTRERERRNKATKEIIVFTHKSSNNNDDLEWNENWPFLQKWGEEITCNHSFVLWKCLFWQIFIYQFLLLHLLLSNHFIFVMTNVSRVFCVCRKTIKWEIYQKKKCSKNLTFR